MNGRVRMSWLAGTPTPPHACSALSPQPGYWLSYACTWPAVSLLAYSPRSLTALLVSDEMDGMPGAAACQPSYEPVE